MPIQLTFGFVLEYVTDLAAARDFYVDHLGLKVEQAAPVFIQFNHHLAIASDESMTGTRDPEIYWLVADVEAAFTELSQKVEIAQPLRTLPFGKLFAIKDPAGRPLFILEFAQDRPSQPV